MYYKGNYVYRVMLLFSLTLQPSHISVGNESLPLPAAIIKFIGLYTIFSRLRVSISAYRFLIMDS